MPRTQPPARATRAAARPRWSTVLRALREVAGVSQAGWVALLQLAAQEQRLAIAASEDTLQRWEAGRSVPDAAAEAAIIAVCRERGLLRGYSSGALAGETVSAAFLHALLADARGGGGPSAPVLVALPPAPRGNLPAALSSFIGRGRELGELERALSGARLMTLTGMGGAGKTRLALELARTLQDRFPDGVWLVELAALASPAGVPQAVVAALGVREALGRSPVETLVDYLGRRRLLLLLDNCEHVIDACAGLAMTVLGAAPHVQVLATSRERLGVPGEVTWPVPPLALPSNAAAAVAAHGEEPETVAPDAVLLFAERARAVRPGWELTAANAVAVAEVCRRLDGIPLAIELAAARLNVLTVEQIAARLEEGLRVLASSGRAAPARQRTLRAALDWSYDLLSASERLLLGRVAVFAGGFTLEAAEEVCAGDGVDRTTVLDVLSQLADRSWLVVDAHDEEARYRLLTPVWQYVQERLEEAASTGERAPGEADRLAERHVGWCVALAQAAERGYGGSHQQAWLARTGRELENMRAALGRCGASGDVASGLGLAAALAGFWDVSGRFKEGRQWLERGLAQPGLVPPRTRARSLLAAARLSHRQSDYPAAAAYYEEGLALARETGDDQLAGRALCGLGVVAHVRGKYDAARALLSEAMEAARMVGDRVDEAAALYAQGLVARAQADYGFARARFEQALAIWRDLGDRRLAASALNMLGLLAEAQSDYDVAQALLEESLALKRDLGDRQGVGAALGNLGMVAVARGDHASARSLNEQALAIAQEVGDRRLEATTTDDLGRSTAALGDFAAARAMHERAVALYREMGDARGLTYALNGLAFAVRGQGNYADAGALFAEVLDLARELEDKQQIARVLGSLAYLAILAQNADHAEALLWEALGLWRELGSQAGLARWLQQQADLVLLCGRPETAARLLGAAEVRCESARIPVPSFIVAEYERTVVTVRAALGDGGFAVAWAQGRALTLEQAIAETLEGAAPVATPGSHSGASAAIAAQTPSPSRSAFGVTPTG
jgi:predicted ATPase